MNAEERRTRIGETLQKSDAAVPAGRFAEVFGVSRQIIVGDIALLRAAGAEITATPRGYIMPRPGAGLIRRIPCRHSADGMKEEMQIMVDNGCRIRDVIVEHPVYGQLVGELDISTRHDIDEFISRISGSDAAPLSDLTGGIHLHTLICPDMAAYTRVCDLLRAKGFLYDAS